MSRKPAAELVQAKNFSWKLYRYGGGYYAEGRSPAAGLGKHCLGTRDEASALRRLKLLDERIAAERGKGAPIPTHRDGRLTIVAGWEKYLMFAARPQVMKGASPATVKRYRAIRDHHLEFCYEHRIQTWADFDKCQLERFGNERSSAQAYRTVYLELTTLKSVSKWLAEEKLIPADCQLRYSLSKPQGTDAYCYRPTEVARMIEHCSDRDDLVWLANLIIVLAHTGLRISEAADLRWTDVDLSAGMLRVADERTSQIKRKSGLARTTKGRRPRVIPLHSRLRELFASLEQLPDGRVLHSFRGRKLRPRNVLTAFLEKVIEPLKRKFPTSDGEIGFEHGRLHSFRHYFCSQCFICGASEGEVREWLGHADSKMVDHYRHLRSEDALRRMGRITFLPAG